jgi:O-antigen/teichoic acid export membrane protein
MVKTKRTDSYSHILKYTGVFGGVQGLGILVGIIRNKLVAMILGPAGMGLISLFNSTINLISNTTNLGLSMSAVRNISELYDRNDEGKLLHAIKLIRSWSLVTALLGIFLCIVMSQLLNMWTFEHENHTLDFILLSPVVGLMAVTGGETAILKGTRQLKKLAGISIYNVLSALVITVPIYYFFGVSGIVPSLVIMAIAQMLLTILYSYRLYPFHISKEKKLLSEGLGMVKLGVAFVIAGVLGSGAEFIIRSFLNNSSSLDTVGLYSAGYLMTMTYAGMVFSAMETDFFPRLSAVQKDVSQTNLVVNRQIEVSLLLIAPLLVFFMISLPILLPLFYSAKFTPVIGMMQITVLAMYFRALRLPVEYLPLAKGDSCSYLLLEAFYDMILVILVISLFRFYGLTGAGIAITIAGIIDFVVVLIYAYYKYGYVVSAHVKLYTLYQLPLGILAFLVTLIHVNWVYWGAGFVLFLISLFVSINILKRKVSLWGKLKSKFLNIIN